METAPTRRTITFGVRGLTCPDCLVLLMGGVRDLPRVRSVTIDLRPHGESSLTIGPADAVAPADVRALVHDLCFVYTTQRRGRLHR